MSGRAERVKCRVFFAEEKIKEAFERLKESRTEDRKLYGWIDRALKDIREDCFCGLQIPKKQIPKEYLKKTMWTTSGSTTCRTPGV